MHPYYATIIINIGNNYKEIKKYSKAIELY